MAYNVQAYLTLKKWQENPPRIFLVIFSMSPSQQLLASPVTERMARKLALFCKFRDSSEGTGLA